MSDSLWTHGLQHASLPSPSIESVMLSNHFILCYPFLLRPSIFPNTRVFSNELVLCIRWPNFGASASVSVLPKNIQGWFPLGLTGLISLQSKGLSRVSQESSPAPQFKSINSALKLYSPTLTSIHDYWRIIQKRGLFTKISQVVLYICFKKSNF